MKIESVQRVEFTHPSGTSSMVEVVDLAELRGRFPETEHSIFRPTRADFHLLQCVTRGRGAHWVDYQRVPLEAGDLLHVRPRQLHSFDRTSTHEAMLLVFLPEAIPEPLTLRLTHPLRPAPVRPLDDEASELGRLVELMFSAQQKDGALGEQAPLRHLFASMLLAAQIVASRAQSSAGGPGFETAHAFDALIDDHLAERRSLSWFGVRLRVSVRTLTRACAETFGTSAKQHLDGRVALEAKRQLVHTDDTVDQIGARIGFSESTNFVKFFRRLTGETPMAFRQRVEAADLGAEVEPPMS